MPFYEGLSSIGFINEKHITVVIDFGTSLTKVGFAGESSPRAIIKSEIRCRQTSKTVPVFIYKNNIELTEHLVDFIYIIYFKYLLVNPKDCRVVVVENILGPAAVKKILSDVLFKHYEISSLLFLPSHLVTLMTLGITTGLVVDIGHTETTIIPIYEGIPILNAWRASPVGSKAIKESLKELLLDRAMLVEAGSDEEKRLSSAEVDLTEKVLEDIQVRCCFVSTLARSKALQHNKYDRSVEPPPPPASVKYSIRGNCIITIPGTVCEMASEVLLEKDEEKLNIPSMIFESILKCPIDTRKGLSQNLVIIGGTASITGLKHRILSELRELVSSADNQITLYTFKLHQPPIIDNCVAWLGGAIYGCTEATPLHSTTKETYIESGCICDWSDLSFNIKDDNANM